ncbi:hypothetical protein PA25_36870 [Pseudoalteromonas sp. A25]|nr:hypothetical protein PA25_36870 [Pseudoalteromonas sp. A25]
MSNLGGDCLDDAQIRCKPLIINTPAKIHITYSGARCSALRNSETCWGIKANIVANSKQLAAFARKTAFNVIIRASLCILG